MLYKIAHILRDKLPWIWDVIGIINSFLFGLRYDGKMGQVQNILTHFTKTTEEDGNALSYRIDGALVRIIFLCWQRCLQNSLRQLLISLSLMVSMNCH